MNIALVCPDGLSTILFCKGIIRSLQNISGARVFVLCDAGSYEEKITALGVTCISVPIYRWNSPWQDFKYFCRLTRSMRRNKVQTVLNFSTKPNIYGAFAARLAGVGNRYMHVVGRGAGFEVRADISGRLARRVFIALYRLACSWSDKIWFTNTKDRQFFIDNGLVIPGRTVLTRNYLDTSEYALSLVSDIRKREAQQICGVRSGEKVVIMVARMIWQKGISEFAEAAELLHPAHPGVKFILIAPLESGSPDAVPESYIREKERTANFCWLGFQEDVKRFYAIAALGVLPTYYKEGGYPRALLEPMAMGKPVITTDSEDCRGAVEDGKNGFLVPVRDSKALADAINRILSDDELSKRLGMYSRLKAVRDFDEDKIVPEALRQLGLPVPTVLNKMPASDNRSLCGDFWKIP